MMMMNKPKRIQRKRTKGWRMPEGAVSVTRPGKWGNPFTKDNYPIEDMQNWRREVVNAYAWMWSYASPDNLKELEELRGKDLACWCKEGEPCHADVLLELANKEVSMA